MVHLLDLVIDGISIYLSGTYRKLFIGCESWPGSLFLGCGVFCFDFFSVTGDDDDRY